MEATLNYYPASEWFADPPDAKLAGRRIDIGTFTWLTGVQPPCNLYLGSEVAKEENGWAGQNWIGCANPEFDAACNTGMQSLPGEDAYVQGHMEAQRIFAEDLPSVPLYLRLKLAATRPDMCNFIMDPTANTEMWNVVNFDYGECDQ